MKPVTSLLLPLLVAAGTFSTPAVAAGFQFDTQGGEPFYQTELPRAVYQYTQRDDLQDLVITNAAGEQVPYALLPYEALHPQETVSKKTRLTVYPIRESRLQSPDGLRLELEKSAGKTTLNVIAEDGANRDRIVMLVDAGLEHPPLQYLTVDWAGRENQLLDLQILVSDDLKTWSGAGYAALLKTAQNGQVLVQNSIVLDAPTEARYVQIRTAGDDESLELTSASAEYRSVQAIAPPLLWQDIHFVGRDEKEVPGLVNLDFEAAGHYPASHVRVRLPQENTVTSVTVLVRNRADAPWTQLARASVFHLKQHGKTMTNPDLVISPTVARYWRLQFSQSGGGIGAQNPGLSLGWLAPVLVWNARGQPPYTLHIGEAPREVNRMAIASLIPEFKLEKVRQLSKVSLAHPTDVAAAQAEPKSTWVRPVDYKRWLLWGGLFLGVLLLAGMAYSLMKSQSREQ